MKTHSSTSRAFSFVELLVVLALLGVIAAIVLPRYTHGRVASRRIACVNNLKQVTLGSRLFAFEHDDQFPMSASTNVGGTLEFASRSETFRHFQALSNELNTPKVLVCPTDRRVPVTNFAELQNEHLSYFMGVDAKETNFFMLLAGDRNVTVDDIALDPGVHELERHARVGWATSLHNRAGNVALADGSVQQMNGLQLQDQNRSAEERNRVSIP